MSDFQVILFIGRPASPEANEHLQAMMAGFTEDAMIAPLHCETLECVWPILEEAWPDLVCVFADGLGAKGEDVGAFCQRLREQATRYRPILVVQTGGDEDRRMQYLIQGADDILGVDLSGEEFKIRLLVQLRRNLEINTHEVTRLPNLQFTQKVVQRRLNRKEPVALLSIEIDHFDIYNEIYGELPAAQVMRTFAAMLSHLVLMPDFISHTEENNFVVVSNPDKADKISALLCRQFETVAPNFYSEKDRKQGYMISVIADNISRRVPLMSLSIGIASTGNQHFESFAALFASAQQMKTIARMAPGCSWQSERPKLSGEQASFRHKPGVLVLEGDAALAFLLKTTLEMEGYEVDVASGIEDARAILTDKAGRHVLDVVILDALINEQETGLLFAGEIHQRYPEIGIICTSSLHDRQRVLQAGADLYLPKPFELSSLFSWIERLLAPRSL